MQINNSMNYNYPSFGNTNQVNAINKPIYNETSSDSFVLQNNQNEEGILKQENQQLKTQLKKLKKENESLKISNATLSGFAIMPKF